MSHAAVKSAVAPGASFERLNVAADIAPTARSPPGVRGVANDLGYNHRSKVEAVALCAYHVLYHTLHLGFGGALAQSPHEKTTIIAEARRKVIFHAIELEPDGLRTTGEKAVGVSNDGVDYGAEYVEIKRGDGGRVLRRRKPDRASNFGRHKKRLEGVRMSVQYDKGFGAETWQNVDGEVELVNLTSLFESLEKMLNLAAASKCVVGWGSVRGRCGLDDGDLDVTTETALAEKSKVLGELSPVAVHRSVRHQATTDVGAGDNSDMLLLQRYVDSRDGRLLAQSAEVVGSEAARRVEEEAVHLHVVEVSVGDMDTLRAHEPVFSAAQRARGEGRDGSHGEERRALKVDRGSAQSTEEMSADDLQLPDLSELQRAERSDSSDV